MSTATLSLVETLDSSERRRYRFPMRRLIVIIVPLLLLSSCASTGVGGDPSAPGYVWYKGALRNSYSASMPRIAEVTQATLEELDLVGIDAVVDKLKGRITARMADGTKVTIKLKALDFERTVVEIRVGLIGDRAASEQIARHIGKNI